MSREQEQNLAVPAQQRALFSLIAKRGLSLLLICVLMFSLWTYAAGRVDLARLSRTCQAARDV